MIINRDGTWLFPMGKKAEELAEEAERRENKRRIRAIENAAVGGANQAGVYECPACKAWFQTPRELLDHVPEHFKTKYNDIPGSILHADMIMSMYCWCGQWKGGDLAAHLAANGGLQNHFLDCVLGGAS